MNEMVPLASVGGGHVGNHREYAFLDNSVEVCQL